MPLSHHLRKTDVLITAFSPILKAEIRKIFQTLEGEINRPRIE